jgi:amino acid transporter
MSRNTDPQVTAGDHRLKREFKLFSSFAFAFAFISPIVALYGIFGLALTTAGASFWWGFFIVFLGQLLVALVFAMLVSRWPIEGSIYQWSARLAGRAYGWFAGWVYMWTLVIAMATVALGAAGFIANIFGIEAPTGTLKAAIAFGVLIAGTIVNIAGQQVLKVFMTASIGAEVIGSIGLGIWLLLFHRVNDFSVLFNGNKGIPTDVSYLSISGPFLIALAFIGFSFVGFESAGSIAEEVHDPRRNLPKAIIFALSFIAIVVTFSSLAIILATPDLGAVTAGKVADPVFTTLTTQLGRGIAIPVEGLFVIGFLASFLALQTSASRIIWATARDGGLPGSHVLSRLSKKRRQPVAAILVTTVIGALLFLLSYVAENIYTIMVNFTSGGFFLSFLFPLAGFVVVLLRGTWKAGVFSLRGATLPIALIALVWAILQFVNIAWPRAAYPEAYLNWSIVIGIGAIGVIGMAVYPAVKKSLPNVRGQEYRMLGEIAVAPGEEAESDLSGQ